MKHADYLVWTDSQSLAPTDRPKHRAHRALYFPMYERIAPRATCSTGKGIISCDDIMCPKHRPANYSEHMARHTPESFRFEEAAIEWWLSDDPIDPGPPSH